MTSALYLGRFEDEGAIRTGRRPVTGAPANISGIDSLSAAATPLRIFLVEDSTTVRDLLTEYLQDVPHVSVIGAAESEASAVNCLLHLPCDVVIVDIKLREGSGMGVLRALQERHSAEPDAMIRIIFSNYTEQEYRKLAEELGALRFFDKSSDLILLLGYIRQLAKR